MSHSVTITRTTTTNDTSAWILNTEYLKTLPGLLKLAQLFNGAVCLGIIAQYYERQYTHFGPNLFFLLMVTTFLILTFCLLVSCLFSRTGDIISQTIYEHIYNSIAATLILIPSIYLIIKGRGVRRYEIFIFIWVLSAVNGLLHIFSAVLARRSYRGI